MNARQIIQSALFKAGILAAGETPSADMTSVGLDQLKEFLRELVADGLMLYFTTVETFTLTASQGNYTIGTDGSPDFNTERPAELCGASVRDSSDYDYDLEMISENQYREISDKTAEGLPFKIWYNPTSPNGTLYLYYVPDDAYTLLLHTRKPLTEPTALTSDMDFPVEYEPMLTWNLAVYLGEIYGKPLSAVVAAKAGNLVQAIKRQNIKTRTETVYSEDLFRLSRTGRRRFSSDTKVF